MSSKYLSGLSLKTIEKHAIRRLFIFAVILGSIGTLTGTLVGSPVIAIGVPVIVMLGYIWWTMTAEIDIPNVVIGDSFYYLGFILTLVALTASLISLRETNVSISNIIGSFGAAMITTIIGLIARLVTTTFSVEAAERREKLDREIEREMDKFLAQLRTMTEKVTGDFVSMTTDIGLSAIDTKKSFNEASEELNKVTSKIGQDIDSSVHSLCSRINEIKVSPDIVEDKVKDALSEFDKGITTLTSSYEQSVVKLTSVNKQLIDQYNSFEENMELKQDRLVQRFDAAAKEQVDSLQVSLNQVSNMILSNRTELTRLIKQTEDEMKISASSYVKTINELSKTVNAVRDNMQLIESISKSIAQNINKRNEVLEQESTLFLEKSKSLDSLQTLNEGLVKSLESSEKRIVQHDKLLSESSIKIGNTLESLNKASDSLNQMNEFAFADLKTLYADLSVALKQLEMKEA